MAYTLTYTLNSDGNSYTLSGYSGDKPTGELVIPDSYDSKPVTSIGNSVFAYCNKLTSITIPNSVTNIGEFAFRDCFRLTSITIGNGVTIIGRYAFAYCSDSGLTSITIPNTVTEIKDYAFYGCSGLTSVTIPDSVTSIGYAAFGYCSSLTSIIVSDGNTIYRSDGNCIIKTASKTLITGCKTSVIPDDGSVTSIGDGAFYGCSGLTSVTIPDSVTSIGSSAFSGCSSLASITIPFVGAQAGKTSSDTYQYPFGYIFGASSYTGGTATKQEYYGGYAGVTVSTTYYIPSSLKSVTVTGGNILYGAFYNCNGLTSITIPNSVTSIGSSAFYGCSGLTSVTIPDSVTSIGSYAFSGCTRLTNIYYTGDIASWCGISGLGNIMSSSRTLYIDGEKLEGELVIPAGVTSIKNSAFSGCSSLTNITIPDSVTSIGGLAFSGCTGLTSVNIPDGVTSIEGSVFYGCSGLISVTIPDSVTSIGYGAFRDCNSLMSVTIPNSVTSIGSSAFGSCSSLTKINMLPTTPPTIQNNTLDATVQNIYVPAQSAETYKTATNWNTYADKITEFPILDLGSLLMYNNKVKAKIASVITELENEIKGLSSKLSLKQDILTFDLTPTEGSSNPATSEGIKAYVDNAVASAVTEALNTPI